MTNKEAIEELRTNKTKSGWGFMCGECPAGDYCNDCELNQALELAIKALENSSWIPPINEYKKRALAIVDVYSDINKISQRDAEILRKAILFNSDD